MTTTTSLSASLIAHLKIERKSPAFLERLGVTLRFAPGAVTVSSLNNDFDNLFILTGEVLKKEGYAGSSGWLGGLRVNHHCPSARGDLTAELNEMAS